MKRDMWWIESWTSDVADGAHIACMNLSYTKMTTQMKEWNYSGLLLLLESFTCLITF